MEIPPVRADLNQVTEAREGEWVEIESDVLNVAADLYDIDPHIRVRWSERGGYFCVYWREEEDGSGELITTAQELDQRVVTLVRRLHQKAMTPGYSFAEELENEDARKAKERDDAWLQEHGEMYERLAHALRKDTGHSQAKIIVPNNA